MVERMKKMHIVVLNLLLLNHMAQSLVLLTANIEDIKKLAKKFVSESLAEKIAEFIAKATEQVITNVSEENLRHGNHFHDISKENNNMFNEARQRNQKEQQRSHQRPKIIKKDVTKKATRKVTRTARKPIDKRPKRPGRVNLKSNKFKHVQNMSNVKKEPVRTYEKYFPAKQYSYSGKYHPKLGKNQPQSIEDPQTDSTMGVAEKMKPEEDSSPNIAEERSKSKFLSPNRFRLTANSQENGTIQPNDFDNLQKVLTTRKERNEFDLYDNSKYPKAEYVATSGPVVLPKIPSPDWWDKEEKEFKSNKDWD